VVGGEGLGGLGFGFGLFVALAGGSMHVLLWEITTTTTLYTLVKLTRD